MKENEEVQWHHESMTVLMAMIDECNFIMTFIYKQTMHRKCSEFWEFPDAVEYVGDSGIDLRSEYQTSWKMKAVAQDAGDRRLKNVLLLDEIRPGKES